MGNKWSDRFLHTIKCDLVPDPQPFGYSCVFLQSAWPFTPPFLSVGALIVPALHPGERSGDSLIRLEGIVAYVPGRRNMKFTLLLIFTKKYR